MKNMRGKLYSVGIGPGDPELLTLKAVRLLKECDVVALPKGDTDVMTAKNIVNQVVDLDKKEQLIIYMPMTKDMAVMDKAHQEGADAVIKLLDEGKNVVFITLGCPTVYATCIYVHKLVLKAGYDAELVAGVTSICAVAAKLNVSLCERAEPLIVLPGSYKEASKFLDGPGNKVLMKSASEIARVRDELKERGLIKNAAMVERCGLPGEKVYRDLNEIDPNSSYFIGAGPGAADLITVKGKELLEKADLIIYAGSLVNPELLNYAKPECIIMDSAKMTLEEVIAAMVPAAQAGKLVVRLHTGDPSVYGAHREQIDLLRSYNLDFEIVPGVSSFCAAAACLDAEYTLPNVSQSVIITRMEGRTPVPNKQKIADYAAHKATMVIFLSSGMLEKLQKKLIAGGYTADTPAAIVYKASWPDEKVCRCTVGTLAETAKEHNITKTALITVGNFLGNIYDRSELYNPTFAHGYRAADPSKLDLKPEVK